jgi:hypothetical protein
MATKRNSEKKLLVSNTPAAPVRRKSAAPKRISRPAVEIADASETEEVVLTAAADAVAVTSAGYFGDAVARLAYSYWEARGYQGGSPESDWLRAEQELSAK